MSSDDTDILWRRGHRPDATAEPLPRDLETDLLVIGGGFTGCAAALEAAEFGAGVVVLEAGTIGHGGSGRNVGLVNAGLWLPPDAILRHLGEMAGQRLIASLARSPDTVFGLIEKHGITCGATRNGTLHLAHSPAAIRELESRFRQGNRGGAALRLLDAEETARRTGSRAFHAAILDPRAGTIQPLGYCRGLARAARSRGAKIFEHVRVRQISRDGGRWFAHAGEHAIRARYLLVATNGYGGGISGVPEPELVPVHYSQFATAPLPDRLREHILPGGEGCWDTDPVMSSLRMDAEGRLVVGGVGNVSGIGGSLHRRWATRKLAQLYPELDGTQFQTAWSGRIAMTSDHLPKALSFAPDALSIFGYSGRGIGPGTIFGIGAARALLFGETGALPVAITGIYRERFKSVRAALYEFGATLSHAVRPIPRGPREPAAVPGKGRSHE